MGRQSYARAQSQTTRALFKKGKSLCQDRRTEKTRGEARYDRDSVHPVSIRSLAPPLYIHCVEVFDAETLQFRHIYAYCKANTTSNYHNTDPNVPLLFLVLQPLLSFATPTPNADIAPGSTSRINEVTTREFVQNCNAYKDCGLDAFYERCCVKWPGDGPTDSGTCCAAHSRLGDATESIHLRWPPAHSYISSSHVG